jgi:adenylate cyclase
VLVCSHSIPIRIYMAADRQAEKFAVILHADVADSTRLVQQDEHLTHNRIRDAFGRLGECIAKHNGNVLELRGDAILAEFERPSDAVTASITFQSANVEYMEGLGDNIKPHVRIGIAVGEVIVGDNTATGAGVVLAQRVEQLAEIDGLCITSAIHEAIPRRIPFDYESLGEHTLKGFDDPVRVFRVKPSNGDSATQTSSRQYPPQRKISRKLFASVAVLLLGVAAALTLALQNGEQTEPGEKSAAGEAPLLPSTDKPSVAVLPFVNISSDAEQGYFADGMTEDLITDISRISDLDVIAGHSTFTYKGQNPDVRLVGQELGASHVIEGSVRKAGSKIRISIQLIDAATGRHVWAERYDRELRDVFAIQDEVIGQIVANLLLKLTPEEQRRVARHGTENIAAYDLYMRGRQQESFLTRESAIEARRYYEQAVALDVNYAEAWAHLAQIHIWNGQFGWVSDIHDAHQRALVLAEKSIELDPELPFGRFVYARALSRDSIGQYQRAIEETRLAIDLDPNYADAYAFLGQLYTLTGQAEKTAEPLATAMRINPNFPFWYHYIEGFSHFFLQDFDTSVESLGKAMDKNPNVIFLRLAFAAALAMAGREDDAEWQIEELQNLGFGKTLDEYIEESPINDPAYRAQMREGLARAGLS